MHNKRLGILFIAWASLALEGKPCWSEDARQDDALAAYTITSRSVPSIWQKAAKEAKVLCQDGGFSIVLPDGSALWSFGDTFIGYWKEDGSPKAEGGVSSSVCRVTVQGNEPQVQYRVDARGTVDFELPLDKANEDWSKHRIWPRAGVHLNGASYLFFGRVVVGNKGVWDFKQDAVGLARAEGTSWDFERIIKPQSDPPLTVTPESALLHSDGNVYLHYIKNTGKMASGTFVARVPADKLADPKAYQYWCGQEAGFTADESKSKPIVTDVWGQVSVVRNEFLDRFVMLHVGGVLSDPRTVYLRTAKTPFGPWSDKVQAMKLPGKLGESFKGLVYCAYLHPELFREQGRIMAFTYCIHEDFGSPSQVEIELLPKK
jgi:hypothetical protein